MPNILGLGLGINKEEYTVWGRPMSEIGGLKAWYRFNTGIFLDPNDDVAIWRDSSGNVTENMTMLVPGVDNDCAYNAADGGVTFSTADKSFLASGDALSLDQFTILAVLDITEAGASDEQLFGRVGNTDFLRVYSGGVNTAASFEANNVASSLSLSSSFPAGKFLLTLTRRGDGQVDVRINGVAQAAAGSNLANLFDFNSIGDGASDFILYELAVYNVLLSGSDLGTVESDINERNGL